MIVKVVAKNLIFLWILRIKSWMCLMWCVALCQNNLNKRFFWNIGAMVIRGYLK